jgi:ATP-binding cassette subfamily B protein
MPSKFSHQRLAAQLIQTLGVTLPEKELADCLNSVEILEPQIAKLFWRSLDAEPGIYIVLKGKVRLLDTSNNLIATFSTSGSFGEITLFPKEEFHPYAARASTNLQLSYLSHNLLQSLMGKYPNIREHLYHQAEIWDLLLLYVQNSQLPRITAVERMLKVLSLFQQHNLEIGSLPTKFIQDSKLWLLRRGELLHSDGFTLTPGRIYAPISLEKDTQRRRSAKEGNWQIIKPTIAYSLSYSDWQTALDHLPQLAECITNGNINGSDEGDEIEKLGSG